MFLIHLFVYSIRVDLCSFSLFFFSSSWCRGLAAACEYGTLCTFLLIILSGQCFFLKAMWDDIRRRYKASAYDRTEKSQKVISISGVAIDLY